MFTINDDYSIYATRGDTVFFTVMVNDEMGNTYYFEAGDVLRIKIYQKKNANNVVLEKCFPITAKTDRYTILLTEEDTKIGNVISKPVDYWYEIELNPFTNPQTIIGYDDDGAKVFRLMPEGADSEVVDPDPEDIPVVDDVLDMTSNRPVQNQAIARAIVNLEAAYNVTKEEVNEKANETSVTLAEFSSEIATERARIDNLLSEATADDAEVVDVRVGADGVTYGSAGTAVRSQFNDVKNALVYSNKDVFTYNESKFQNGNTQGWEDGSFTDYYLERIATPEIQKLPFAAVLSADDGFRFSVCLFENGELTSDEGWLTEYALENGAEFRLMIARVTEDEDEVADIAEFASAVKFENMSKVRNEYSSVDFGFIFGACDTSGLALNNKRLVTKDILNLSHAITLKYNSNIRMAVFTYDDADGTNAVDHGWVTQDADYTIPGGTYFRIIVTTASYDDELPITEKSVYDTMLYQNIDIRVGGSDISMMDNAVELAKRNVDRVARNIRKNTIVPQKVNSVNHRGFNWEAPENTLSAYKLSKKNGFDIVECDISWTSDNVPVLLHDDTVDRTSNGTGNIVDMTFEEVRALDFGSWKSDSYAGELIPSFEEFICLCRNLAMHPYIELKGTITSEQASILVGIVKDYGMLDAVTWISFVYASLKEIQNLHESARLGLCCVTTEGEGFNKNHLMWMQHLSNEHHNVFFNADENSIEECVALAKEHGVPLEIWSVNTEEDITAMPPYVTGITSDYYIAHKVLNPDEASSGGNVDQEAIASAVETYMEENPVSGGTAINYDQNVKAVNHRGYSTTAPENTIPAYILSKQKGFTYVEADVSFTSDGVAVLLHDQTIDRTSTGSGTISEMTYEDVLSYDFGSWKASSYAGTKIATFEEFIILCKRLGLHPYIELKDTGDYTEEQIQALVATVKACGMVGKVTWISFISTFLGYVKNADATARLGYLYSYDVTASLISTAQALQTGENEVFLDIKYTELTDDGVKLCVDANIPLEVWTVNDESAVLSLNPYITGVTSDSIIAGKTLYDVGMVYEYNNTQEETHAHSYTSSVTTAATCTTSGIRTYTCSCGSTYTETIAANGHTYVDGVCSVCGADDPTYNTDVTLSSISATYSGGDVSVGTDVVDLTGIAVTATYSDGSTETVSGYTLSGEIAEGENTVTVSYGGMTATFTVTGVAEESGDSTFLYNWDFTKSLVDTASSRAAVVSNFAIDEGNTTDATLPTQDESGISLTQAGQYIYLGDIELREKTIEIDVANFDFQGSTSYHIRLLCCLLYTDNISTNYGYTALAWRSGNGWTSYLAGRTWGNIYSGLEGSDESVINYFSGKTIKLVVNSSGIAELFVDGVSHGNTGGIISNELKHIYIGGGPTAVDSTIATNASKGNQVYNALISGVRIYENA